MHCAPGANFERKYQPTLLVPVKDRKAIRGSETKRSVYSSLHKINWHSGFGKPA